MKKKDRPSCCGICGTSNPRLHDMFAHMRHDNPDRKVDGPIEWPAWLPRPVEPFK